MPMIDLVLRTAISLELAVLAGLLTLLPRAHAKWEETGTLDPGHLSLPPPTDPSELPSSSCEVS